MKRMKFGKLAWILSSLSLFVAASSFAAVPQDCWKESGLKVMDGEFIVSINAKDMSINQLFKLMNEVKYAPGLLPSEFPVVDPGLPAKPFLPATDPSMIIFLKMGTLQTYPPVSREELKAEANQSIQSLLDQKIPGVKVSCNAILRVRPFPGVTISN